MGFGYNELQNKNCEDGLQDAAVGRPSRHQHFAIHPKPTDPWYVRWGATRDLWYQHDWDTKFMFVYAFKGFMLSALLGATYYATDTHMTALQANKGMLAADKGLFSSLKVSSKVLTQFGSVGAIAGVAYYWWFYQFLTQRGHNNTLGTYLFGHAVFGAVVAGCIHPRRAGWGLLFGTMIGATMHLTNYGNNIIGNTAERGFVYEIPNINEQQREVYKRKDKISDLSRISELRFGHITKL